MQCLRFLFSVEITLPVRVRFPKYCATLSALLTVMPMQAAKLSVTVLDDDGRPTPVRAWVDVNRQRFFEPTGPDTATPYTRDRSFSCDGRVEFDGMPADQAVVHIERGKEFRPVDHTLTLTDANPAALQLSIRRWIDLPAEGWYSADLHIHLGFDNPRILAQLSLADDVHLCPAFTYWYRGREDSWPADWPADRNHQTTQLDVNHVLTWHNIEIERIGGGPGETIGASFLFNLSRPVAAERFGQFFPTDASLILAAREHSPQLVVDADKPMWSETVVGAALGCYDTVQLCHNHYHRNVTLRGGFGMIGPLDDNESNFVVADGLFHRTNNIYYRLLNCGFRIAASGGSAIGVMGVPNGYNRTYALLDGNLTEDNYWHAVRAGRTIATSGPILTMQVNGQAVGSEIQLATSEDYATRQVTAVLRLRSIQAIEGLQLIQNGRVVRTVDLRRETQDLAILDAKPLDLIQEFRILVNRSGFVAARALFRAPDGLLRQAHTSPVYLTLDGRPAASTKDARYMMRWIDRLISIAGHPNRYPDGAALDAVLDTYRRAREVYQRIEKTALETHGD